MDSVAVTKLLVEMPVDFYEWTQAMLISRVINCLLIVFPLVKLHTCTLLSTKLALLQGHLPSQFSNFSKIQKKIHFQLSRLQSVQI